ncbi:MAG: sensor protein fixL [Verrucomicrobiaceae bacterium]|nr:sensor protein fixL [Verrucomicrobiaceae bacterium]
MSASSPISETPKEVRPTSWRGYVLPLRYSVPALLLLFGLALITFQAVFFAQVDSKRATEATMTRCSGAGVGITRSAERGSIADLHKELTRAQFEFGIKLALVCDSKLTILSAKDSTWIGSPADRFVAPEAVGLMKSVIQSGHRDVRTSFDGKLVLGAFPVIQANPKTDAPIVLVELDLEKPLREAMHVALLHAVVSGIVLFAACGVLWIILDRVITKRVTRILNEARAISHGTSSGRPLTGGDELAEIDRALRETHSMITEQAAGLRAREERYRLMVESLPAMVYIARDGGIDFMNSTGLRMLGKSSIDEVKGRSPYEFIAPQYHEAVKERIREVLKGQLTAPALEEELTRDDGTSFHVEAVGSAFTDERGQALQVVMHDISERKAAEARREALGREITNASEREQRRIGQDLHDDICQRLAAVKMNMQDLEEKLAEQAPMLMDDADSIVDRLTDAIRITRGLARGLSPVDIEAGGLGMALAALVRSSRELLGIECELETPDDPPDLKPQEATELYRIAQEAISNAAKHGVAGLVRVLLRETEDGLMLRVSNNGRPFDPAKTNTQGMGLAIMRYRAESIGASLEFELLPPDASVAVRCVLPLRAAHTTSDVNP